jgi:hypothetical protein
VFAGLEVRDARTRPFVFFAGTAAVLGLACLVIWLLAGFGYFWPAWPLLGLATAVGVYALIAFSGVLPRDDERARLTHRVEELTRTRAGAVDAEADVLRRVERDLHDGAQARLVSLLMTLGMAEDRFERDPAQVRGLVGEAKSQARLAITELRNLARGIAPPILVDRGLEAALDALVATTRLPATLEGHAEPRPPASVETCAYFVATEALANARGRGRRPRRRGPRRLGAGRPAAARGVGRRHVDDLQPGRGSDARARGAAMRAVIAEDLVLLREGLERLLRRQRRRGRRRRRRRGVVPRCRRSAASPRRGRRRAAAPGLPRRGTARGADARRRHPGLGVLVLSQYVEPGYAAAAPRSTRGRRAVRAPRAPRCARGADRARAEDPRPDGGGALERRDRPLAGRHHERRREARAPCSTSSGWSRRRPTTGACWPCSRISAPRSIESRRARRRPLRVAW